MCSLLFNFACHFKRHFKRSFILNFIRNLLVVSSLASIALSHAQAEDVLIKQVRVISSEQISGEQARVSAVTDVLIRHGKIVAISPNLHKNKNRPSSQIDGRGRFLIPGLIDSHVHLDGVPGYAGDNPNDAQMLQEARLQMPRSYAYFGFTTVLDLTGDPHFIAKWNAQAIGPQAQFCAPVTIPNGYPASWMDKELQFQVPATKYMLFDPAQPNVYPANFKVEEHTPKAVVKAAQQDGASCIKVFYETGFGPKKNLPVPSLELIQDVVKQAKSFNMPVYLHGNSQASYEFALKAGITTLVHGMWHEAKNVEPLANQARLKKMAQEIMQAGISVQPTMQVLYGEHEVINPDFFKNSMVAHAIPKQLMHWYQTKEGQWMTDILAADVEPSQKTPTQLYQNVKSMYQKPYSTVVRMTQELHKNGAQLLFGSDTPSGPFYSQFPGINGRWEMDRWLEAGISLPELFSALTMRNAIALGLAQTIGSVEVGKQADLLILSANPLLDVKAYDTIEYVILRGKVHQRSSLSARNSAR